MKQLRGRKALITGAARGIGRCLALTLAKQGMDLCLLDLDGSALEAVAQEAREHGIQAMAHVCDLTDPAQITASVQVIREQMGAIHLLINNAGLCHYGPMRDMAEEHWRQLLAVNLHAPIQLTHELLPVLEAQDQSHVVNICSMFGLVSYRKIAMYQTSKFALLGFTEALRAEYAGTGLGVSAICPGFVGDTTFFADESKSPPAWVCCTAQTVADRTVKAIGANRALVVITPLARVLWWARRLSPWLMDRLCQWGWGASQRKRLRRAQRQ